jgi:hypothetical protein
MRTKWSHILIPTLFLAAVSFLFIQGGIANSLQPAEPAIPYTPGALGDLYVVLNEVMPKPAPGGAAWVELYVGQSMQRIYLPTVLQASSGTLALEGGGNQPLTATSASPMAALGVDLRGWQVSNELGQQYTLPDALSDVAKDVHVLIFFDGTGPENNDYDDSDGKIVLHTPGGLGDIFSDEAGQVALYRSGPLDADHIVDFLTWGGFSDATGANALAAGIWGLGQAVSFENGFGDISPEDLTEPEESLGRYPGAEGFGAENWANYPPASLTPGSANPVQPVLFITPEDGARVDATTLSLSWRQASGATGYQFQLDDNADFSSPLINIFTTHNYFKPDPALSAGAYYWRVQPLPGGSWSAGFQIDIASSSLLSPASEKVLGIQKIRQNKDSRLLGLDGAPEGDATTDLPENAWDAPAPCVNPPCADYTKFLHGNMYCVRASTRMMASYYGGSLTMDRLSYYILQEWSGNTHPGTNDSNPDNDLGFNRGMYYPDEEDEIISWALKTSITTPGGKPVFSDLKTWIDGNRPIMFRRPGHMMVIDGYRDDATGQFVHVLDPDQPPDLERWQDYSTQTIDGYWVGPTSGTARSDETAVSSDSDGDGIMDFDEVRRFFTDPYDVDSDNDWVPDKQDMREYVFDNTGSYNHRGSDWDGDGVRKELDADNDNDGTPEGCEDTNYNGKYESTLGETDNFNAGSNQACEPVFEILYSLKTNPTNAGDFSAPDKILGQVSTAVPAGWTLALTPGDFTINIGGAGGSVLAIYPSADTYFLVIDPPTQPAADYYDLSISLSGSGTDTEQDAVFYLPKSPNDEVIVLDRSGSMLSDDKIAAAQNAASAFVDFLNDDDMIGVTSFATTASTDYPLTTITPGSTVREDAITAINSLTASGTTALGQGVQQGYGLLTASGGVDHDWSLVLLSDGWENVPPYWADIEASVTDAVVHTVALGEDADAALLQSIAGVKHGNYFYVDVNPPILAAQESLNAPPLDLALTLPNRLADTYVSIGELTHSYQRLASQIGNADQPAPFSVEMPAGLPDALFTLNWDSPGGYMRLVLTDPAGVQVKPDEEYFGATHHVARIKTPAPGSWRVAIQVLKPAQEYQFMLSGKTNTTLIAAVGGDPAKRTVGVPVPIYGVLTDLAPIQGANVTALITGPGVYGQPGVERINGSVLLPLFDDGAHGDGKADDGLYANELNGISAPGGYTVKVVAEGTNNASESFLRYANAGFSVLRRVAYVWKDAEETRLEYEKLLIDHRLVFDAIHIDQAPKRDFSVYDLIIIGPDSGYLSEWGTPEAVSAIIQAERPVLGLGEGGYAFFGQLKLGIGYPNGAHSDGTSIDWVNSSDAIWGTPYNITLLKEPLQLYQEPSNRVDIYLLNQPPGLEVFGLNDADHDYANLLMESGWFMLWGFDNAPDAMTEKGRRLFVNTVMRSMQ